MKLETTQFPFHDVGVHRRSGTKHREKGIPGDASGTVAHELVHCNRFLHASWLLVPRFGTLTSVREVVALQQNNSKKRDLVGMYLMESRVKKVLVLNF